MADVAWFNVAAFVYLHASAFGGVYLLLTGNVSLGAFVFGKFGPPFDRWSFILVYCTSSLNEKARAFTLNMHYNTIECTCPHPHNNALYTQVLRACAHISLHMWYMRLVCAIRNVLFLCVILELVVGV